ncbi:cell division protein [Flavicella sediminum]|uniref:cell division protein n=1 Tax=Flavicella sediminum TaxID=2585141 RepID=UPI001121E973|nr:cell division protein [Flavicella sediminum]
MTTNSSRNIPLPIQREVRKRCGFGCVICGLPLYEYEHMEEWAKVKRHLATEITLLCDKHHKEKTNGLLPKKVVVEANKDPFNLRKGVTKPYNLYYSGDTAKITLGSSSFSLERVKDKTQLVPLLIDNIPIIGVILLDGHYLLNLILFDEYNNLILHIKNNQLVLTTELFDIQLIGKTLTIREAKRKIFIVLEFKTPNEIVISRGTFLLNGVKIIINSNQILIKNTGHIIENIQVINSNLGITIGKNPGAFNSIIALDNINRYNF